MKKMDKLAFKVKIIKARLFFWNLFRISERIAREIKMQE